MSPGSSGLISRRGFLGLLGATAAALGIGGAALWLAGRPRTAALPPAEAVAADVKAEFLRTWRAYVRLAWGHDELKPISGGYQEFFARGHPVGLTIVESLDTLYLMGLDKELASAVRWVETNLDLGTRLLARLLRQYGGSVVKALAAYNGGEDAVAKWERRYSGREPDEFVELISFRETRDYVKSVLRNYRAYRRLYAAASPATTSVGSPPKAPFDMMAMTSPGRAEATR